MVLWRSSLTRWCCFWSRAWRERGEMGGRRELKKGGERYSRTYVTAYVPYTVAAPLLCLVPLSVVLTHVLVFICVVFQTDASRTRPSGILRVFPRFRSRDSGGDGLQTVLRPGLVTNTTTLSYLLIPPSSHPVPSSLHF